MITTDNRLPNMGDIAPNTECSVSAPPRAGYRILRVTEPYDSDREERVGEPALAL